MTRAAFLAALLGAASAAAGAPGVATDKPALYSHAIPLQVSGKQAVVQLRLPPDVYLHARSPQLADLRVFDAAGAAQPFALTRNAPPLQTRTTDLPARVFPVFAPAARTRAIDDVQVRTAQDGSVVAVTTHAGAPRASGDVLAGLVLDLGALPPDTQVAGLTLTPPQALGSYHAQVAVEASDDLQHWEPLAETAVSWLVNGRGETVRSDRIAFPARAFRYARISWIDGDPVEFPAIAAQAVKQQEAAESWDAVVLALQRADPVQQTGRDLVYAASGAVPAERAGLVLQGQNVVLPATIGRYVELPGRMPGQTSTPDFRPLASATFYRLTQDGKVRVSGDVALPETHLARWVVRTRTALADAPALRLQWRPATLVFVAGGTPPYTLAFGRADAPSVQAPLAQVAPGFDAQELARLEIAAPGKLVVQQPGAPADEGNDAAAAHRRILWLWALLLCGVAFLGWMAWRLVAQLKREGGQ